MLKLNDPRWSQLKFHIPDLPPVPICIENWIKSIGTPHENDHYEILYNQYLHQVTILSCAFAVIPHIVATLPQLSVGNRVRYLVDVAQVEVLRSTPGEIEKHLALMKTSSEIPEDLRALFIQNAKDRMEPPPVFLEEDYFNAVETAKRFALDLLSEQLSQVESSQLLGVLAGLFFRNDELSHSLMYIDGDLGADD